MLFSNLTTALIRIALGTSLFLVARPAIAGDLPFDSGSAQNRIQLPSPRSAIVSPDLTARLHTPLGHHEAVMMSMLGRIHLDDGQISELKLIESRFLASVPSGQLPPHAVMQAHINSLLAILTPAQRQTLSVEIRKVLQRTRITQSPSPMTTHTQMDSQ